MPKSCGHNTLSSKWKPILGDIVIFVAALVAGFLPLFRTNKEGKVDYFVIEYNGSILHKIPASIDTIINISVHYGSLVVKIEDGKGAIIRSSCPNKICVHTGWIESPGQSAICIPNKIILRAYGKGEYDAILR